MLRKEIMALKLNLLFDDGGSLMAVLVQFVIFA